MTFGTKEKKSRKICVVRMYGKGGTAAVWGFPTRQLATCHCKDPLDVDLHHQCF